MQIEPSQLFIALSDKQRKQLVALTDGVDLTPELAISDLEENIDFVIKFIVGRKNNKAHVIALLQALQDASTDLARHLR
jgi:hypothetical protein